MPVHIFKTQLNKIVAMSILVLSGLSTESDAEPLKYLGLELGVERPPFPVCTDTDRAAKNHKRICWISKPYVASDGEKLGPAFIPDETVASWASIAIYNLHVSKKNGIRGIEVDRPRCDDQDLTEIITSINARFGQSRDPRSAGSLLMRWESQEGYVQLFAHESICKITYRSPELQAEVIRKIAERKKVEQARPKTP